MTRPGLDEESERVVREVAYSAARGRPWVDVADLLQEGRVALIQGRAHHDPKRGPWAPYAARLARNRIVDFVARARCPLTTKKKVALSEFWGVEAASLDQSRRGSYFTLGELLPSPEPSPEEALERRRRDVRRMARALEILGEELYEAATADRRRRDSMPAAERALRARALMLLREDPELAEGEDE